MTNIEKGYQIIDAYDRDELSYDEAHTKLMEVEPLLELELIACSECK